MATRQVRIIGGKWKRRQLTFADRPGLRPTPDRLRETLFNWLMFELPSRQLAVDLCAGSGVLGFEALSRGVAQVILIEPDRQQFACLEQSRQQLQAEQAQLICQTAQQAAARITGPIDLLFLDPLYALNLWAELARLYQPRLATDALIYVEADRPLSQLDLPVEWQLLKSLHMGQIFAGLLQPEG